MRQVLKLASVVAATLASTLAIAAGPYDGVYRVKYSDGSWGDFISVHSNGAGHMQLWKYRAPDPTEGTYFEVKDGSQLEAKMWKFGNFDLYSGSIASGTATLTGTSNYGQCNSTVTAVFSGGVTGNTIKTSHTGTSAFGNTVSALCLNMIWVPGFGSLPGRYIRLDIEYAMERQYP